MHLNWGFVLIVAGLGGQIAPANANLFSCEFNVNMNGLDKNYDLRSLAGNYEFTITRDTPPSKSNLSWFINPCGSLESGYSHSDHSCDPGTQVCGIKTLELSPANNDKKVVTEIIPLVSDKVEETLVVDAGYSDNVEFVKVMMLHGNWGDSHDLALHLTYICDPQTDGKKGPSDVKWWSDEGLYVDWKTSLACSKNNKDQDKDHDKKKGDDSNNDNDNDNNDNGSSWGWFTWLFILFVLVVAVYVIGSAWVNYNQHGLTGVELLPHSDTLRDLPYLVRDLVNKMVNTFASGSSRAGYSAV